MGLFMQIMGLGISGGALFMRELTGAGLGITRYDGYGFGYSGVPKETRDNIKGLVVK